MGVCAACCSVLQRVAVRDGGLERSVLQFVAVCCGGRWVGLMQFVAACRTELQRVGDGWVSVHKLIEYSCDKTNPSGVLQCVAVCCCMSLCAAV